jgi:HlyD family secretion protein
MVEDALKSISNKKKGVFILLAALVIAGLAIIIGYFNHQENTLARVQNSLTATGTIEATTVNAAFKIPGKISKVHIDEGMEVKQGQVLAELESQEIAAKLAQARGAAAAAQGQSRQAEQAIPLTAESVEAAVQQAQAMVEKAQVGVTNSQQQFERVEALHKEGAISTSDYDKAKNAYDAALNDMAAAQGKLNEALSARMKVTVVQHQHEAAQGQAEQAQGAVQEAQAYLDNTKLLSPINGFVTIKYLEAGEMLNAGTPVFEISDLRHSFVKVYIDEKKIGRVKLDQEVEVTVPAYPDKVFKGKVVKISDAGDFAVHKAVNEMHSHDIRSFKVKIDLDNKDLKLKTGMTASVTILEKE